MPTFHNPKFAYVEPRGGGGGLVAVVVVAGAAIAAVSWLVRELLHIWVEVVVIVGGTIVVMGAWLVWMAIHYTRADRRGLPVNAAAKAEAIAQARAAAIPATVPAGETHHHYGEQHIHHHQELHIHQAPPAAEPRPSIATRKVVPGVVLGTADVPAIAAAATPPGRALGEPNHTGVIPRPHSRIALRGSQRLDDAD